MTTAASSPISAAACGSSGARRDLSGGGGRLNCVGQHPRELLARTDAQFREHLAQVPFDSARTDEQLGTDLRVRTLARGESGLAAYKLSKMTVPGAFDSDCQVPALSSKMIDVSEIEELHVSLYCCVQLPGTPLLPVAVSSVTLPE